VLADTNSGITSNSCFVRAMQGVNVDGPSGIRCALPVHLREPGPGCRRRTAVADRALNAAMRRVILRDRHVAASFAILAALVLASCGGSSGGSNGAQPVRNGNFAPGAFIDLPKPGGQQSFGPPTDQNGTWVQSFEITGLDSSETMQFYVTALGSDWTKISGPTRLGHCSAPGGNPGNGCTYRAVWSNSPEQLEIVAGPDGTNKGGVGDGTELSLLLTGGG
jgi:hypothetical protein